MYTNLNEIIELHQHLLNIELKDILVLKDTFYFNNIEHIRTEDDSIYIYSDIFMKTYAPCMFQFLTYLLNEQYSE